MGLSTFRFNSTLLVHAVSACRPCDASVLHARRTPPLPKRKNTLHAQTVYIHAVGADTQHIERECSPDFVVLRFLRCLHLCFPEEAVAHCYCLAARCTVLPYCNLAVLAHSDTGGSCAWAPLGVPGPGAQPVR